MKTLTITLLASAAISAQAAAQDPGDNAAGWNTPWGGAPGGDNRAFNPSTRDSNGNRVIVNGRLSTAAEASTLPWTQGGQASASGFGSAYAVGNQLNVITQGDWNTVIIDSTQINNGDVTAQANSQSDVLNGEIDLDD